MRTDRMIEPLTDEEFESLKDWELDENLKDSYHNPNIPTKIGRLIATIELQKSDKNLGKSLVRKIQELKEENEILIGELKEARQLNENN